MNLTQLARRTAAALAVASVIVVVPTALQAQSVRRTVTRVASGTVDTTTAVSRGLDTLPTLNIDREVFAYRGNNRRDPYESLMRSDELRPLVSDLRLTAVAFDPNGKGSVAILRDVVSLNQYRVRVGQTLGRLRVSGIRQKAVIFSIDEFGFSRQETLPLTSDSTNTRTR